MDSSASISIVERFWWTFRRRIFVSRISSVISQCAMILSHVMFINSTFNKGYRHDLPGFIKRRWHSNDSSQCRWYAAYHMPHTICSSFVRSYAWRFCNLSQYFTQIDFRHCSSWKRILKPILRYSIQRKVVETWKKDVENASGESFRIKVILILYLLQHVLSIFIFGRFWSFEHSREDIFSATRYWMVSMLPNMTHDTWFMWHGYMLRNNILH